MGRTWEQACDEARMAARQGSYQEAEALYLEAADLAEATLGRTDERTATLVEELLHLQYCNMSDRVRTLPTCLRLLELREARLGPDHPDLAGALYQLGYAYDARGEHPHAEAAFRRALNLAEPGLLSDRERLATSLYQLAQYYRNRGRLVEAEPFYRRLADLASTGSQKAERSLAQAASVYTDLGRHAEAAELYSEAIAAHERRQSAGSPSLWALVGFLAAAVRADGRAAEAEPLYRRAIELLERFIEDLAARLAEPKRQVIVRGYGPILAQRLEEHAELLRRLGRDAESAEVSRRADAVRRRYSL